MISLAVIREVTMNRFLLGILIGALLGAALGFVAFSGDSKKEALPIHAASPGDVSRAPITNSATSLAGVPRESTSREVAKAQPASATISKARVESALAKVEMPQLEEDEGVLEITGTVKDADGNGIPGVRIRGSRTGNGTRTRAPDSLGRGAPEFSLESAVQSAADRFAQNRIGMREAVTDASGAYVLERLSDSKYMVSAYLEDYWMKVEGRHRPVFAGTQLDFLAKRVVSVPVSVLMPGGEAASEAVLLCEGEGQRSSRLGPFAWTPAQSSLRLPEGKLELTAVGDVFGQVGYGSSSAAALKSDSQDIVVTSAGFSQPLVFQLEGQIGIRGRANAVSAAGVSNMVVYCLRLAADAEVDVDQLSNADRQSSLNVGGEYSFMALTPGRYAVGLARSWGARVEAHRVVELSTEIVRCDLLLPEIDETQYLQVEVFGADGDGLTGASFQFVQKLDGGSSSTGVWPTRSEKGRYFLEVPSDARSLYYSNKPTKATFTVRVSHDDYGSKSVELQPGQPEVQVTFAPPAQLVATILGYAKSNIFGRASLSLTKLDDEGNPANSTHYWSRDEVDDVGVKDFGNIEPGRHLVTLSVSPEGENRWNRTTVSTIEIDLRVGPNEVRVPIPDLYSLPVDVAGGSGVTLYLTPKVEKGESKIRSSSRATCDDSGRGEFTDLLPGDYSLRVRAGGKSKNIDVTVPSGTVMVDPSTW